MNNARRKQLQIATRMIEEAQCIIDEVAEQEREAYDNMPEGLQASARAGAMLDNVAVLEDAAGYIENVLDDIFEAV